MTNTVRLPLNDEHGILAMLRENGFTEVLDDNPVPGQAKFAIPSGWGWHPLYCNNSNPDMNQSGESYSVSHGVLSNRDFQAHVRIVDGPNGRTIDPFRYLVRTVEDRATYSVQIIDTTHNRVEYSSGMLLRKEQVESAIEKAEAYAAETYGANWREIKFPVYDEEPTPAA